MVLNVQRKQSARRKSYFSKIPSRKKFGTHSQLSNRVERGGKSIIPSTVWYKITRSGLRRKENQSPEARGESCVGVG